MAELYFIRHGLAGEHGSYANDAERPLTEEGHRKTHRVAKRLHELGLRFDLMLTSPFLRAYQTAEILQAEKLSRKLETSSFLSPGGSFEEWLGWLESWERSPEARLALVGHQPDLTNWAEMLIWGEVRGVLVLKKAGAIGIQMPASGSPVGNSLMFWLTSPGLLR
ncbi:MAG: phosphohistidine phosphatase SixA [Leptolyngbyaceae bacterium]|nr:phosphohistidine phosphatase SixA [Leptolyngbyaceae bacterium]